MFTIMFRLVWGVARRWRGARYTGALFV